VETQELDKVAVGVNAVHRLTHLAIVRWSRHGTFDHFNTGGLDRGNGRLDRPTPSKTQIGRSGCGNASMGRGGCAGEMDAQSCATNLQ
jgi:hypothetical protein